MPSSLTIAIQPDTAPPPEPYVPQKRKHETDPWVRYAGPTPEKSPSLQLPSRILGRLEAWLNELQRRRNGDKPNENWISWGYSVPEMQVIAVKLAERLATTTAEQYGTLGKD
jgi:hypothetical protein